MPILMMSPVVALSPSLELELGANSRDVGVFSPCPLPDWSVFKAEYSSNLVGTVLDVQIGEDPIGRVLVVLAFQAQMFVVSPKPSVVASHKCMVA